MSGSFVVRRIGALLSVRRSVCPSVRLFHQLSSPSLRGGCPGAIVQQRGTGFDAGLLTYLLIAKFHYTDTDTDTDFLRRNSVGSVRVRFAAKKSVSVSV